MRRLLEDLASESATWHEPAETGPQPGWEAIEQAGLPLAFVREEDGGPGLPLSDALELAGIAGEIVLPWPLLETMLARRFAAQDGREWVPEPTSIAADLAGERLVLASIARAKQMAGALSAVLRMTIGHVGERTQFGRRLGQFQAVQHQLAILAGEVAAAHAAADHAAMKLDKADNSTTADAVLMAAGVARARVGEAVSKGCAIAHQLHGAIGYTLEHPLRRYTAALWRWRDQFGTQVFWTRKVGRVALSAGPSGLWPLATEA